ncbi:TMEM56 [Bugula neritina]|uniref:TMEM56 n=1 Tax=Bugula neritina TaxID=10212 RepID=A0A7J7J3S3_BUGNE|nr:TMEM56 [Bugula neritina]
MIRLLAEYSTIFVNFRHALHMFGMQNSSIYFYNGLMMVFSFTCARMIPLPIYIYCILSISDRPDYHSSLIGKLILWLATCVLDSLNVLWYIKMLKGAVKVWKSHKNNASPSPVSASRVKDIKQG